MPKSPTKDRLWIVDSTTEKVARILGENPGGLICFRDELAGLLGAFDKYGGSGGDRSFWIEAYGGRPYRYDRVSLKDHPIDIPFCAVSLLGALQPDRLNSMLLSGDDDGLAARPLYAWPDPVPPRRPTRVADQQEHKQWDAKLGASGRLAGAVGKLNGIALRLALVLELLVWAWRQSNTAEPERVGVQSVRHSTRLIDDWVRPNLERVFAEASLPQAQRDAMMVGRWLLKTKPHQINARDLRRQAGFPGPKEPKTLDAALEMLVDARWLLKPDKDRSGRPRKDFVVNRAIYEAP